VTQWGWSNCPDNVRLQVAGLLDELCLILGNDLVGVYLHGSLAMGCFNLDRSDIDLLAVTGHGMPPQTKRTVTELLLRCSAAPCPVEISILSERQLHPWQYPTPYEFHYSEDWRERFENGLSSGEWQKWNCSTPTDADLAAHITVIQHRGICLHGKPIAEAFPVVPREHYLESILGDFDWGQERLTGNPVYFILNACRIAAYLREGKVLSKDEGGEWALRELPEELCAVVSAALTVYRGGTENERFDEAALESFIDTMKSVYARSGSIR